MEITNDFYDASYDPGPPQEGTAPYDQVSIFWTISGTEWSGEVLSGKLILSDDSASVLTDTNLPQTLDLSAFDYHMLFIDKRDYVTPNHSNWMAGEDYNISSINQRPVPEPTTMLLFGLGLLGLAGVNRRKK